ncbi:MAG: KH domain-containing protein [Treponemataceae bacterium]
MKKDLIEFIAQSLVDNSEEVSVTETEGERGPVLELRVAADDIGKVIGKQGRIAKALRTIMNAADCNDENRYSLEILD